MGKAKTRARGGGGWGVGGRLSPSFTHTHTKRATDLELGVLPPVGDDEEEPEDGHGLGGDDDGAVLVAVAGRLPDQEVGGEDEEAQERQEAAHLADAPVEVVRGD